MDGPSAVLTDRDLDARLRRDGFVVVRLIDEDTAHSLRERYLALDRPVHEGFSIDLTISGDRYRRAADELASTLDREVERLYQDHRPFLRSFLCKHPGPTTDMYLHQDWSYVDERTGARTYVTWVALEDITSDNGQLRVLRGSHRLDHSLRGTALTSSLLAHEEQIRDRLLSVPVRAGEAIIFDNGLFHSSYPNHSTQPRVALAIGMRPRATTLVHFRRIDELQAERYEVDEEFFFRYTPEQLLQVAPDLPVSETIDLRRSSPMAASALRTLDRGRRGRIEQAKRGAQRVRGHARTLPKRLAMALVRFNERLIDRFGDDRA